MLFGKLLNYINPYAHLGKRTYPLLFPFLVSLSAYVVGDVIGDLLWGQSMQRANTMIFITFALVIYFSFRSAIKGGLIVTALSILYFTYYIYIGEATLDEKIAASVTAGILCIIYLLIALIVGWLRQRIDYLIEQETEARIVAEEAKHRAINDRKRLQAILEQLPVGVFVATAPKGKIINTNKEMERILGKKPSSGLEMKDYGLFQSYLSGKNIKAKGLPLAKTLLEGKTIVGDEIVFTDRAKNKKVLLVSAAPIQDENGKIIAGVSTMHDITKQKELERQKEDFLGIASHELKTPVTSIKAYVQVLSLHFRKAGDAKSLDLVAKMDNQLNKLTNLINDLLNVTKIEGGKLHFNERHFNINDLIEEVVEELQRTTNKHSITIIPGKTKLTYGDREHIGQVLTNLLTNAIKYSPSAKEIIVKSEQNSDKVIVSVQDFGVGIPEDKKENIFQRFYRVEGEKQETFAGLGLGLYLSREIIRRHKGSMWVESKKGEGSIFYFSLPTRETNNKPKKRSTNKSLNTVYV